MNNIKLLSLISISLMIANLVLFSFRMITPLLFWIVIVVVAILAYFVLPKIKEKAN